MENRNLKIGVIGLGLIGGSILKALSKENFELYAMSKSSADKAKAYTDKISTDIKIVKDCDVVFVCSKMNQTLEILDKLSDTVSESCVVTDVCSLKRFVNNKKRPYNFIGSHPMAGTEFSGFENSFPELFQGAKWILNKENEILEFLIKKMGANPVILGEHDHDKFACLISHLPMLISTALFDTVSEYEKEALKIASSGFRDTTRLALTNPDLAFDMLNLNFDNFEIYIDKFVEKLQALKKMNEKEFKEKLQTLQKLRSSMYDKEGKNRL